MKNKIQEIFKEIKFVKFAIKKNWQSSMELKASFWTAFLGMAINNISFVIIWMSFGKIAGDMGGWKSIDYLLAFGISTFSFGIVFGFLAGMRSLPEFVKYGEIDKFLLSPKNLITRISISKFEPSALGDLLFGICTILVWIFMTGNFSLFVIFNILFFTFLASCIWFYFSLFINSISFYFADGRTVVQGLFEMLITPSIFYGGAFQGLIRNIFIFIIPAMLLGNLPAEIIKNPSIKMYTISILVVSFWIFLGRYFFYKSIRKYESSNFINFG